MNPTLWVTLALGAALLLGFGAGAALAIYNARRLLKVARLVASSPAGIRTLEIHRVTGLTIIEVHRIVDSLELDEVVYCREGLPMAPRVQPVRVVYLNPWPGTQGAP
jgi:hypothetical protein